MRGFDDDAQGLGAKVRTKRWTKSESSQHQRKLARARHSAPVGKAQRHGLDRNEVGTMREERVVLTFSLPGILPAWFDYVRPGTPAEDHRGIDVVVQTHDLGPIGIQVKGCKVGVAKFRRMYHDQPIAVVIVRESDSDLVVRNKTIRAIMGIRVALLEALPS